MKKESKGTYPSVGPESWVKAGERMRKARKEKGLSIEQLCEKIGYHGSYALSLLENGRKNPANMREKQLRDLCDALGMTVDELCGDCVPKKGRTSIKTHNILSKFQTPLAQARISADMTQEELAEKFGVSRNKIALIEGNYRKVPREIQAAVEEFITEHPPKDWVEPSTPGERLAEMRKNAGLTQKDLSYGLGIPAWHISRMEGNVWSITQDMSEKIERFLESDEAKFLSSNHVSSTMSKRIVGIVSPQAVSELKARRKALGITQKELASALGKEDNSYISLMENGKTQMTKDMAEKIKNYMDKVEKDKTK